MTRNPAVSPGSLLALKAPQVAVLLISGIVLTLVFGFITSAFGNSGAVLLLLVLFVAATAFTYRARRSLDRKRQAVAFLLLLIIAALFYAAWILWRRATAPSEPKIAPIIALSSGTIRFHV